MTATTICKFFAISFLALSSTLVAEKYNVLFIISDDLSSRALGCYGNTQCKTPHIDKLATQGIRFKTAYCQYPVCGASRASFMSGMYPHKIGILGNGQSGLFTKKMGSRYTLSENFHKQGYYAARVSKIYHMLIPGNITEGVSGPDHKASWNETFNFQGDEWFSKGEAEAICRTSLNMDKDKHYGLGFGEAFYSVKVAGVDAKDQPDYKAASKTMELIDKHGEQPFFLGVGLIRPHVPLVAPQEFFDMYSPEDMKLAEVIEDDLEDIPKSGIGKTAQKFGVVEKIRQQKALAAYYASTSFMDAQFGRIMDHLEKKGLRDKTIVVFTSDHGWHLGEHSFWQKMNLHEEAAKVPLIISVPGQKPFVSNSLAELIDLYPTLSDYCGLNIPQHVQGKSLRPVISQQVKEVRDAAFCVLRKDCCLLRTKNWALMQYGDKGERGSELYDMVKDPKQYTNLAGKPEYGTALKTMQEKLQLKLKTAK
ncbi:MAG: iduronate 2-sulfatase [Cryomorphaceae bacterium]|jgi:iduronate 2-sulfatase